MKMGSHEADCIASSAVQLLEESEIEQSEVPVLMQVLLHCIAWTSLVVRHNPLIRYNINFNPLLSDIL